ncbi:hypothetical protein MCUN1_002546 [Malassezia cuniculi]|uniref:Ubiquitin-like domain-containing protein n=1 Tax=Malassezia cuniculi TaxID=948313 RepID=A0AAF0J729_9BASI|nr:hypothetical protein MCUN1_002546 [Malassezia cuniculi]
MSRPQPRARRARQVDEDDNDFFVRRATQSLPPESDGEEELVHKAPCHSAPKKEQIPHKSPPPEPRPQSLPPTPTKCDRSRSVSITPPPEPESDILEFARDAVERVVNNQRPVVVDTVDDFDTSNDTLELNPGLARYYRGYDAAQMRERALQRERELQRDKAKHSLETRQHQTETIEILDSDDDGDDDNDDDDVQLSNPHAAAEEHLSAPQQPESSDEMSLTLRSADGKELVVRVRPTTTIAKIAEHFAHTFSRPQVMLSFEGERLAPDTAIGDTELEDEDMLEVV